jgi:hypothetical protein
MNDDERRRLEECCERAMVELCQTHARLGNRVTVRIVEPTMVTTVKNFSGRGRNVRLVTGKKAAAALAKEGKP